MFTCEKIMQCLEDLWPVTFAESWDNVGLLIGRKDKQVQRVLLCVDVTEHVMDQAIATNVDMIISHHPVIFSGMKRITDETVFGAKVLELIRRDICVYVMHTNFDVMGMADAAAEKLGLLDTEVLQVTYEDDIQAEGIGRTGKLKSALSLEELAQFTKEAFDVSSVKVFGNPSRVCVDVAICPGAGKSLTEDVIRAGVDVYITGDIDHHTGLDLMEQGIAVIDAGHYGIEKLFVPYMYDYFKKMLPDLYVVEALKEEPFWIL